jgi:hypothetical protein
MGRPSMCALLVRMAVLIVAMAHGGSAACGDPHSGLESIALSAFVNGATEPIPLPGGFSSSTCTYKVEYPPAVRNLLTVAAVPTRWLLRMDWGGSASFL